MRSSQDHSHAANVENFTTFLTYIESLGARYNPAKEQQQLTYMQTRLTETRLIMTALANAEQKDLAARDERRELFDTLIPIVVRVVRIFSLCDVSKDTINTAKSILKKMQGRRLSPAKKAEDGNGENGNSQEPVHHEAAQ